MACHIPVDVVELAPVVLLLGYAVRATHVVTPLLSVVPASNWIVLLEAFAETVNVALPLVVTAEAKHELLDVQSVEAADSLTCARAKFGTSRKSRIQRYFLNLSQPFY